MKKHPLVSFVVSVYRIHPFFTKCIESIVKQEYPLLELILVDDREKNDRSPALKDVLNKIGDFADISRIHIIENQANIGLTASLNKAVDCARGEHVARIDAEDWQGLDRIRKQVSFAREHNLDIVGSFAWLVDGRGRKKKKQTSPLTHQKIKKALLKRNCLIHSTILFKRESVFSSKRYNESFLYAQDYELYLRSMFCGLRFGVLPECLVYRLYEEEAVTVKNRKSQIFYALSAQCWYFAQEKKTAWSVRFLLNHILKLCVPNRVRALLKK